MANPPKSKFLQLFERDQGRCVYCGMDLKADQDRFLTATEDHLVPASKGGKGRNLENLILLTEVKTYKNGMVALCYKVTTCGDKFPSTT